MRNEILLFVGILIFFFVLWLYNGGPNNPISFAGPYITPVTNVGQQSSGYGPTANELASRQGPVATYLSTATKFGSPYGPDSTSAGTPSSNVRISNGNLSATDASQEYLTLTASGNATISGWQLMSTKTGARVTIPEGVSLLRYGGEVPIALHAGDIVRVSSGYSNSYNESYRDNECTGYLDSGSTNASGSNGRCPSPVSELGSYYSGSAQEYDQCLSYVQTLPGCRVPDEDSYSQISSSCQDFIERRLSYSGCVDDHRNDSGFYGSSWNVFLRQHRELWRSSNDTIQLLDGSGKVVDTYSY